MAISTTGEPSINVTPLIDVLLVLLIIFMVVAPTKPGLFETKTPRRPNPAKGHPDASGLLVVTIEAGGAVSLNSQSLTRDELAGRLASELALRSDRRVFVQAPVGLRYGEVVSVLDDVAGAGAEPIALQVDFLPL